MSTNIENAVRRTIGQIQNCSEFQIKGGTMLLAKDTKEYLERKQGEVPSEFTRVYNRTLSDQPEWIDKKLSQPLTKTNLPDGFARQAEQGDYDVSPLTEDIYHEWIVYPGEEYLQECSKAFNDIICGEGGIRSRLNPKSITTTDLAFNVAILLLTTTLGMQAVWVPLACFIGMYVAKIGLEKFCDFSTV